jgi:hypothetical protein
MDHANGTPRSPFKKLVIHPDLYKTLRLRAVEEDRPAQAILHEILCRVLDRPDLTSQTVLTSRTN